MDAKPQKSRRKNLLLEHWSCSIELAASPWSRKTNCLGATELSAGNRQRVRASLTISLREKRSFVIRRHYAK